jgi:uroporphyrinogen decarboxylase
MLQVFESWAGELGPVQFREFCLPYIGQIAKRVKHTLRENGLPVVPMTVFAKGAHFAHEMLSELDYECMSIDWTEDPSRVRTLTKGKVTLQGNLDPCALFGSEECIKKLTREMLEKFGCTKGTIANLGHGMHPDHDPEKLKVYLDAVHEYSKELAK